MRQGAESDTDPTNRTTPWTQKNRSNICINVFIHLYMYIIYIYICFFQSVGLHIQPNPFIYLSFQLKLCAGVPPCPARCHGRRNAQSHDEPWVSSHGVEESKYSMSTH